MNQLKSQRDWALYLARQGFPVLPLQKDDRSKTPKEIKAPKISQTLATRDEGKITEDFWKLPYAANVGIVMGSEFVAIDIDCKNGKDGFESLRQWEAEIGKELPPTRTHRSPTDGQHLIYRVPGRPLARKVGFRQGIDIITGENSYLVAPGSTIHGRPYTVLQDLPIVDLPLEFAESIGHSTPKSPSKAHEVAKGFDLEDREHVSYAIERARTWLKNGAPISIRGQGGDATAYKVAARLKDFGVPQDECLNLMLSSDWHNGCGWAPERLKEKVDHAYRYTKNELGSADPRADFEPVPKEETKEEIPLWVQEMNEKYFVVNDEGEVVVGYITPETFIDERGREVKRDKIQTQSFENFKKMFCHIQVPGSPKTAIGKAWLEHSQRKQYENGFTFLPNKEASKGYYNLWRGFAVESRQGNWEKFQGFIRDVICNQDERVLVYLMNWLARMIQIPWEPGSVAIVLRGKKGTGKDTFSRPFVEIFGHHGIAVAKSELLNGRFNSHLRDAICVFANEASFAGDRANEGFLKSLITEGHLTTEEKFKSARMSRNMVHLLMASNSEWVVPASADERRFLVLDVSDKYAQDSKYFAEIKKELASGGLEAMLFDLLRHDISEFDVFNVPKTAALTAQKIASLTGPAAWLFDVLSRGGCSAIRSEDWYRSKALLHKTGGFDDYKRFSDQQNEHAPRLQAVWGKVLRSSLGSAVIKEFRKDGTRYLELKPLWECRKEFEKSLGVESLEWEDCDGGEIDDLCS